MGMQVVTSDTHIDIDHHFKVIAGPGAGKTRFLIGHIRNVLCNSNRLGRNRRIACITYTNVAVNTILQKLEDDATHVEVSTIHSFLYRNVVKPYIFLINDLYNLKADRIDNHYDHIVSSGFLNKTNLVQKYKVSEKEMKNVFWEIDGKSCKLRLKDRDNTKDYHSSLLKYKTFFWEKGIIHHEDVLAFSWEIVNSSEGILRVLRSKFPYFFVDEFQDTNPIQAAIIKLIGQKETIVGVVGDAAQSIYGFQGADVKQFKDFELPDMAKYKIEDNHRSTEDIIKVLNLIRHDISQQSPSKKSGGKPIIIVDSIPKALLLLQDQLGKNKFTSLSYSNITANAVRNNLALEEANKGELIEEIFKDSDHKRSRTIISLIKAIELARLHHYKDALSELNRLSWKSDGSNVQRTSLIVLKTLLNDYDTYRNQNLWHFYERIKAFKIGEGAVFPISKIIESKNGKTPTNIETFYKKAVYSRIALHIRIVEDNSLHRTIHKAKGDEFDNVLLFVKGRDGLKYNEDRDLGFLLNPDITGNEDHRVYYVACSRAKHRLYITVPTLSMNARDKLKTSCLFDGL